MADTPLRKLCLRLIAEQMALRRSLLVGEVDVSAGDGLQAALEAGPEPAASALGETTAAPTRWLASEAAEAWNDLCGPESPTRTRLRPGASIPVALRRAVIRAVGTGVALHELAVAVASGELRRAALDPRAVDAQVKARRPDAMQRIWRFTAGELPLEDAVPFEGPAADLYASVITHGAARRTPARGPTTVGAAAQADRRLWGGLSSAALEQLEQLADNPDAVDEARSAAAWSLARWRFLQDDPATALDQLHRAYAYWAPRRDTLGPALLETAALLALDRRAEAHSAVEAAIQRQPEAADLRLFRANTLVDDNDRLAAINAELVRGGLTPLRRRHEHALLAISNIVADAPPRPHSADGPKVSVLVPAYDAEATLACALDSLTRQTWRNVEVLVVDDASTDGTPTVIADAAAHDPRIIPLRHEVNTGAYAARNTALAHASGDLVIVHDADDWSHPQKLERQVDHFLAHPEVQAAILDWARVDDAFYFLWSWRPGGRIVSIDLSSLMIRREALRALGPWDRVRAAGDTEMRMRIEARYGPDSLARLHQGLPLAFSLRRSDSLTQYGPTHVRTILHGVRREYREAAKWWHDHTPPDRLTFPAPEAPRPFPAPARLLWEPQPLRFDVLFVTDSTRAPETASDALTHLAAAVGNGLRVGVFHWQLEDTDAQDPLHDHLRALAAAGDVRVVVADDLVEADAVIVCDPRVLRRKVDRPPQVQTGAVVALTAGELVADTPASRANAAEVFGREPLFADWSPLVDAETLARRPVAWRGAERRAPVVARRGSGHYSGWPRRPRDLVAAFCGDQPCVVRLIGGAEHAERTLGALPSNWTVVPDADWPPTDVDVVVHWPREGGRPARTPHVLEAMAAGLVVVLPPAHREVYGHAALYAEPAGVWPTLAAVWADRDRYLAQAAAGRRFALTISGWNQLANRLQSVSA